MWSDKQQQYLDGFESRLNIKIGQVETRLNSKIDQVEAKLNSKIDRILDILEKK